MLTILKHAIVKFGKPRFVVTDHGGQFQKKFTSALKRGGVAHVCGKVRSCKFNGKVERFFRTFKLWQRLAALFLSAKSVHKRLDAFSHWYNIERCHQAIKGLAPEECWTGTKRPPPIRYLASDPVQRQFAVRRKNHAGDPNLPVFDISIARTLKKCA